MERCEESVGNSVCWMIYSWETMPDNLWEKKKIDGKTQCCFFLHIAQTPILN